MRKQWLVIAVLVTAGAFCLAQSAQAQMFRYSDGYRGYYPGYSQGAYSQGAYSQGGYSQGGYYYGNGYMDRNNLALNNGYGWNDGFNWDQDGWNSFDQNRTGRQAFYPPDPNNDGNSYQAFQQGYNQGMPQRSNRQTFIAVRVPAPDADVFFDNHRTQQGGIQRFFETPPLQSGSYTYQVRAKWRAGGRDMDQTRTVQVRPGQLLRVDFMRPANAAEHLNQPGRGSSGASAEQNQGRQNQNQQNQNQTPNQQNRQNQNQKD